MAGLDPALVDRIEKLAQYVAQTNGAMENIARERYRTNPDFAFLFGGDGAGYYNECLRKFSTGAGPSHTGGMAGADGSNSMTRTGGGGRGIYDGGGGNRGCMGGVAGGCGASGCGYSAGGHACGGPGGVHMPL